MSVNITTTTTTTTTYNIDQENFLPGALSGGKFNPESSDILLKEGDDSTSNMVNNLPISDNLKGAILSLMGMGGGRTPSSASAANTIRNFQQENNTGLLSAKQMSDIADTGYYQDKSGNLKPVSADVQAAAQALMANGGALFKQLESANTGKQDGLLGPKDFPAAQRQGILSGDSGANRATPGNGLAGDYLMQAVMQGLLANGQSEFEAGKTIDSFMKDNKINLLSADDVRDMAQTGYYKDKDGSLKPLPENVREAAEELMENGGELFKKLESANTGKQDGLLGHKDFGAAVKNGSLDGISHTDSTNAWTSPTSVASNNVLPSAYSAGNTMDHFLKDNKIDLLSANDVKNIAETGYYQDKDGKLKAVPPEVQQAAQALMANGGQLFKQLESANTGKQDGLLGQKDFAAAVKNGSLDSTSNTPTIATSNNVLPSAYSAGNTMDHFLKDNKIDLLSANDVKNIAETGYYQDKDGKLKPVPPEVQQAAQALMANSGQLFKQLESANTGKQDGLLGQKDFAAAVKNGSLDSTSNTPTIATSNNVLPSAYSAGNTMDHFLKDNKIDLLSANDVKNIAETGYYQDKDGKLKAVPPEVQQAAQALMANGGQLFKQLESANTGKQDGLLGQKDFAAAVKNHSLDNTASTLPASSSTIVTTNNNVLPSAYSAGNTMDHFLKDNKIDLLSANDVKNIAETGYYQDKDGKLKAVSPEVQQAAQALMANGGQLFKQLESANTGKQDGLLGQKDFAAAVKNGSLDSTSSTPTIATSNNVLPSAYSAGNTMDHFLKDNKIDLLSANDVKNIAETGYYQDKDGKLKAVPPEVQQAAQALMANGGQLFKQLESANTGKQDGLLGQKDFAAAVKNGSLDSTSSTPTIATSNNVLPSAYSAGNTMDHFLKDNNIHLLSANSVKNIADTGYFQDKDGKLKAVPPEVQQAAQALMANGGQLFKELESANTGKQDGLLGQKDFAAAVKDNQLAA
jgi:lysozyme family protein